MASNCTHDFGLDVVNANLMWRTVLCRRRCSYCGIKCSSTVKMNQCKMCHVLVHDWCLSPVVVECSAEAATNIRGILKVSEEAWSCRGHRQGQGHGPKGRRIWHLDELKVYGYGYHLHRELEAFLMPSWVPLEHDRIEPVVAEFCRMFAKPTENATRSGTTVETFSAEQRKSTDMARGYGGGGGSRSGRRNRWKRTKATARNQFIS